ncbi:hypothetical protein GQ43DRAFT_462985 [Delitschia confertaspora ATCC 74209]|uniref:BRCT domain-containing protein n=1 Tax=Delitschia confertaspora ATCC 74209 TaxID=1513339 RepID=A0A9P4JR12_9PLEO|nr:hypothetical protein GQ43DRAFT_462985 [Delitschia confertaspora ATCC 74209]
MEYGFSPYLVQFTLQIHTDLITSHIAFGLPLRSIHSATPLKETNELQGTNCSRHADAHVPRPTREFGGSRAAPLSFQSPPSNSASRSGSTTTNKARQQRSSTTAQHYRKGMKEALSKSKYTVMSFTMAPSPLFDNTPSSRRSTIAAIATSKPHLTSIECTTSSSSRSSTKTSALPSSRHAFDPWNSSSLGHQSGANRLASSTSWRQSRQLKLGAQFRRGLSGGERVADTVGGGSEGFGKDERKANGGWERGTRGLRQGGQRSLGEVWGVAKAGIGKKKDVTIQIEDQNIVVKTRHEKAIGTTECENTSIKSKDENIPIKPEASNPPSETSSPPPTSVSSTRTPSIPLPPERTHLQPEPDNPKQIFTSLTFYLNGSFAPHISDHKLRHLLASHGASISLSLSRKSVTHVILGTANTGRNSGCGGGLAGGKIQKEISMVRGRGAKFVGVEWVLECVKKGKRVPEAGFATMQPGAPKGQASVYGMFKPKPSSGKG